MSHSTHNRKNSNNLADEVVNLLDELLETEKKDKPANTKKNGTDNGIRLETSADNDGMGNQTKPSDSPPMLRKKSSSTTLISVPLNRTQSNGVASVSSSNLKQSNGVANGTHANSSSSSYPSTKGTTTPVKSTNNGASSVPTKNNQSSNGFTSPSTNSTSTSVPTKKIPFTPNFPPPPPAPPVPINQTTPKFKPSWSSALSFGSPSRKNHEVDASLDLRKRIAQLEEEIKMADAFKRSLKETLGLQVESMRMDLDLERERSRRLEYELSLKSDHEITASASSGTSFKLSESLDSSNNVALIKLVKTWEEEKKQLEQLKSNRQMNTSKIKDHEENIKRLVAQIKEESIFLISLREQKANIEKSKNYQYRGSKPDQQLGGKLALSESNMKRLNEELEKERKIIHDIENGGIHSVVDKKLEKYIELHELVISEFKIALEDSGGNGAELNKKLEEVISQRDSDKEYFDNKSKIFEKQFEELTIAKESLDREKELISNRLEEEKNALTKITQERELEANKLKVDLEDKHKQLEDENVLLAEKMKQIRELQEMVENLGQELNREKNSKAELEGLAKIAREVEEKQLLQKIIESQQKIDDLQEAFKKEVDEKDSLEVKVNTITNEKSTLELELNELKNKLTESEISSKVLFDKVVETESVVHQISSELKTTIESKESLQIELENSNNKIEELNLEISKLKETVEVESNSIKNIESSSHEMIHQLKSEIVELKKSIEHLEDQLDKEKKENISITQKKNQLQGHLDALKSMLSSVKEDS